MGASTVDIPRWMWLKADKVVKSSLKDLDKGKAVSIPSIRYKVVAALSQYVPASIVARLAKMGR